MPVLGICFVVSVLHEGVRLKKGLPLRIVLAIVWVLSLELFDRYLVAVVVLENEVAEVRGFRFFLELDFNVGNARPLRL